MSKETVPNAVLRAKKRLKIQKRVKKNRKKRVRKSKSTSHSSLKIENRRNVGVWVMQYLKKPLPRTF